MFFGKYQRTWRKPTWTWREHAKNLHTDSNPSTGLNLGPWSCEVANLLPAPPCQTHHAKCFQKQSKLSIVFQAIWASKVSPTFYIMLGSFDGIGTFVQMPAFSAISSSRYINNSNIFPRLDCILSSKCLASHSFIVCLCKHKLNYSQGRWAPCKEASWLVNITRLSWNF